MTERGGKREDTGDVGEIVIAGGIQESENASDERATERRICDGRGREQEQEICIEGIELRAACGQHTSPLLSQLSWGFPSVSIGCTRGL